MVSLVLGALDHANLLRAVAVGFYAVGAAILIGSFVIGVRGPLRPESGEGKEGEMHPPRGILGGGIFPRAVRRATGAERSDSKRNSIALFLLGIALVLIGTAFDPTRRAF